MATDPLLSALQQIGALKKECLGLLDRLKQFSPPDTNGKYPDTFRLMATPMFYSVWERCFTICHAVALRLIREVTDKTGNLDPSLRAIWLAPTSFYQSLTSQIRNEGHLSEEKRIRKGHFAILCDFLPKFDTWLRSGLDETVNTDTLVMTFSNVNPDVVMANARSIGIDEYPQFQALRLGRLHDLVGQRNDIGHGAVIEPPTNDSFSALLTFTENLVADYCDLFVEWMPTFANTVELEITSA